MQDWKTEEEWFPCGSAELIKIIYFHCVFLFSLEKGVFFSLKLTMRDNIEWREKEDEIDTVDKPAKKTQKKIISYFPPPLPRKRKSNHTERSQQRKRKPADFPCFPSLCRKVTR